MQTQSYSILVFDDNAADRFIIQEAFRESGFNCALRMASTEDEAKRLLTVERFDLMLSDFGGNGEEGRRFIQSIRAVNRVLPIIVLSGSYHTKLAYDGGANAFVRKPNTLQEFIANMQGIMKFWVEVAELPLPPIPTPNA